MDDEVSVGSTDLRVFYRKMVKQSDEMYRKRKAEVGPEGEFPDEQAWNAAKTANSVLTQAKRGPYKEWTKLVNEGLEKFFGVYGMEPKTLKSSDLEEGLIRLALKSTTEEEMKTLTRLTGEVLGYVWRVDILYKEFIAIAGELETEGDRNDYR